jgi:carboxyl-terminal processing protease
LVQEQYELSDGSGLRLTVSRYYTPLGRSIQKSYEGGEAAYHNEVNNRFHDGELFSGDSIKHTNAKSFKTKAGKIVYSGGGITPDIFVGVDTAGLNRQLSAVYLKGTLNDFVFINYFNNKSKFAAYSGPLDFEKKYLVSPDVWVGLAEYAKRDSINLSSLTTLQKAELQKQIKLLTARQIWQNEGLYEVSNAEDATVKKALEVLSRQ